MDITYIAYCGVDCSACADLKSSKCPGCRMTEWGAGEICMPVDCCNKRSISACGECADFPCEEMKSFYAESESHEAAFERMRAIHDGSGQEIHIG